MATASAPHDPDPSGRPEWAAAARTEEFYALYGKTVSALCGALLRNRAEAEDAAQQTFLSAHRALLNGSEPREPASWLGAIARNECRSRIAQRMREPLSVDGLDATPARDDLYADAVARADLVALRRAIDALAPKQREALLLREFGGLSYEELAAALAVSGGAVESLLFRARQRLRTLVRSTRTSLAGAPWLDVAARLVAGGGAPVAAKVAALGVGAVAVTGGAVVAPRVVDRPHPAALHRVTAHRATRHRHSARPVTAAPVAPPAARVIQVDRTIAAPAARMTERWHGGFGGGRHHGGRSRDDEPTLVRPSVTHVAPSSHGSPDSHDAAPSDSGPGPFGGHDSHSGSSDDGRVDAAVVQPSSDGSGSGHSDEGGGSSRRDGGGSPVTTTTATATVTTDTTTTSDDGGGGGGDDGSGGRDGGH